MNNYSKLFLFVTIFFPLTSQTIAQGNSKITWKEYRNEAANIKFQIPSQFTVYEISSNPTTCDFSGTFELKTYDDPDSRGRILEYESWLEIKITDEPFDKTDKENRFYLEDSSWIAKSLVSTSLANVEADSVLSPNWFGLEANIFARYYYKESGAATAAGQGYSFFAIKDLEAKCHARLLFDNLGATEDEVGQKIISTLQRIE